MASVSLIFTQAPAGAGPVTLVFGSDGVDKSVKLRAYLPGPTMAMVVEVAAPVHLALAASLPPPTFAASISSPTPLWLTAALPAPTVTMNTVFSSMTDRPTVGKASAAHQYAQGLQAGTEHREQGGASMPAGFTPPWQRFTAAPTGVEVRKTGTLSPQRVAPAAEHNDALALRLGAGDAFSNMLRDRRLATASEFQGGLARRESVTTGHQDRIRDRRPSTTGRFSRALQLGVSRTHRAVSGQRVLTSRGARFQDAMRPGIGTWVPTPPPTSTPCYVPSATLVFGAKWDGSSSLLFVCERHGTPTQPIVVPVREVYMVTNNVTLVRLVDGVPVPVLSASLSVDVDSWAWGFSASLPGAALELVEPDMYGPVELLVGVNGTIFHVLAEQVSRDRSFGQASIRISGRGRNAVLDSPYAPVQTFTNTSLLTSQQLMDEVLKVNGVPMGWSVDWGLEDWNVPAGVFSHQGSHMTALLAIAQAGGGYLVPHAEAKSFKVQPRYPVAPWEWGGVTPDFVLPSAVVTRESMAWTEKPAYNRVYVSGQAQGVLGRVTRAGTAGDIVAPMIVDQLITTAAAARQRGLPVLADTGRQVEVGLRLPVLAETGIILPGAFVQYQDGAEVRLGLVRSVGVDAGFPEVWQTLGVETHA